MCQNWWKTQILSQKPNQTQREWIKRNLHPILLYWAGEQAAREVMDFPNVLKESSLQWFKPEEYPHYLFFVCSMHIFSPSHSQ